MKTVKLSNEYKSILNGEKNELENGLVFIADEKFEINVSKYTSEMLTGAMHTDELKEDGTVTVRIDYKNAGIGSNSCARNFLINIELMIKISILLFGSN